MNFKFIVKTIIGKFSVIQSDSIGFSTKFCKSFIFYSCPQPDMKAF